MDPVPSPAPPPGVADLFLMTIQIKVIPVFVFLKEHKSGTLSETVHAEIIWTLVIHSAHSSYYGHPQRICATSRAPPAH